MGIEATSWRNPRHPAVHYLERTRCRPRVGQQFRASDISYRLGGRLGDGAVGVVFNAEREADSRRFAVKFLAPDSKYIDTDAFEDVLARFRREGQRGSQLEHPALLTIHAYSENAGGSAFSSGSPKNPFIVMERASGGTLEHFLRRLPTPLQSVLTMDETRLRIAIQTAEAIAHLHKRGIVHRDVKPANIFLSARRLENPSVEAKLGDFGVVKWGDYQAPASTGTLTATMQRGLGTMKYMAPEQALSPKDVTVKADIFSFGITLYELFTGRVLPSFHHVYEVVAARGVQGTPSSRWASLGFSLRPDQVSMSELILECFRQGASRRPTIEKLRGNLEFQLEETLRSADD